MELALYQILIPGISALMIAKGISHYLRHERTIREVITLVLFWGGLGALALFPNLTEIMATTLGIKSNVNALVFTLLGVLCFVSFHLLISVENLQQQVTRLTRELALREDALTEKKEDRSE